MHGLILYGFSLGWPIKNIARKAIVLIRRSLDERLRPKYLFFYLTQNDSTVIIESLASLYYLQFAPRPGLYLGREVEEACR